MVAGVSRLTRVSPPLFAALSGAGAGGTSLSWRRTLRPSWSRAWWRRPRRRTPPWTTRAASAQACSRCSTVTNASRVTRAEDAVAPPRFEELHAAQRTPDASALSSLAKKARSLHVAATLTSLRMPRSVVTKRTTRTWPRARPAARVRVCLASSEACRSPPSGKKAKITKKKGMAIYMANRLRLCLCYVAVWAVCAESELGAAMPSRRTLTQPAHASCTSWLSAKPSARRARLRASTSSCEQYKMDGQGGRCAFIFREGAARSACPPRTL